jgi:hypothetical protein
MTLSQPAPSRQPRPVYGDSHAAPYAHHAMLRAAPTAATCARRAPRAGVPDCAPVPRSGKPHATVKPRRAVRVSAATAGPDYSAVNRNVALELVRARRGDARCSQCPAATRGAPTPACRQLATAWALRLSRGAHGAPMLRAGASRRADSLLAEMPTKRCRALTLYAIPRRCA